LSLFSDEQNNRHPAPVAGSEGRMPQQMRHDKAGERLAYYVYILAKKKHGTLYTGVTNDLIRRVWEHKEGVADGFTRRYGIKMLVFYEIHEDITEAIKREKLIKKWRRDIKYQAIGKMNPQWKDLYETLF
jgi:putative endonuclease